jgi:DNA-binding response OmpR family regulator
VRILLVEDEERIATFLEKGLSAQGYVVERVGTGAEALEVSLGSSIDLVILDLGLPDRDGLEILSYWRRAGASIPIIILTARDRVDDRVEGLNLGADDYLSKPFAFAELLARIRAQIRPRRSLDSSTLRSGEIDMDLLTRKVLIGERVADLSAREFALLEEFLRHPNQVLTREQILSGVWQMQFDVRSNLVDVYVGYLRRKLRTDAIETVRGIGYRLRAEDAAGPTS